MTTTDANGFGPMTILADLTVRDLQKESARALAYYRETNTSLSSLNKQVHHDSHQFYRLVIQKYIDEFGDLPSKIGPGKNIKLILE